MCNARLFSPPPRTPHSSLPPSFLYPFPPASFLLPTAAGGHACSQRRMQNSIYGQATPSSPTLLSPSLSLTKKGIKKKSRDVACGTESLVVDVKRVIGPKHETYVAHSWLASLLIPPAAQRNPGACNGPRQTPTVMR